MITNLGQSQKKFNLLYLEEGEHYIQDFFGKCRYFDTTTQSYREAEAMLHFSSRSIIVEFQKDPNLPLYKYLLKFFKQEPVLDQNLKDIKTALPMKLFCQRLVEVPINSSTPKPYIMYQAS